MQALELRPLCVLATCLLLVPLARPAHAGQLGKIKEKVEESEKEEEKEKEERESRRDRDREAWPHHEAPAHERHRDQDCDDDFDGAVFFLVLQAMSLPFYLPADAVDDDWARTYRFENYPYHRPGRAYARVSRPIPPPEPTPPAEGGDDLAEPPPSRLFDDEVRYQKVKPDISVRPGYTFERDSDDILAHRAELMVRTNGRWNLDFEVTDYAEDVPGGTDHMQMYNWHVTYSFAVSPRVHFAAGAGGRNLRWEDGAGAGGLDLRYEAEFFPRKPFHFQLIAEGGWVDGEGAWELEGRAGVFVYKRLETFVGWRHFEIVDEALNGPVVGLSLWF